MNDEKISFETESADWAQPQYSFQDKGSGNTITNFIIKSGLAKDEKSANTFMIAVAIAAIVIAFFIIKGFGGSDIPVEQFDPSKLR